MFALSWALCLADFAAASTIRDDVLDSAAKALSENAAYSGSGIVRITNSNQIVVGSGTLITPEWVLTAAHLVDYVDVVNGHLVATPTSLPLTFGFGADGTHPLYETSVNQIVLHPAWNGFFGDTNDIALLHLVSPVTQIAPARLLTPSIGSELGQMVTGVGYGRSGNGSTGAVRDDAQRRAFTNVIDSINIPQLVGTSTNDFFTDFDHPTDTTFSTLGSPSATGYEGQIGAGDSGGAAYIDVNGLAYVAGIMTFTSYPAGYDLNKQSIYGVTGGYTRVSQYSSFIDSVVPEPSAVAIAVSLVPILMTRRRFQH